MRGKIFVFLGPEGWKRITVKLAESHAHALSIEGAEPAGYGLGKSGWVTVPVRADGVTIALLRDWVEESYRIVAPKRLVADARRVRANASTENSPASVDRFDMSETDMSLRLDRSQLRGPLRGVSR